MPIVSQDGSAAVARGSALPAWLGRLALPLILSLGAALRFANLGENSLWSDEAYSVDMSNRDPFEIIRRSAAVDSHPPLYYLLLRGWISMFGDSEYAVRGLSVVIGVLVIAVVYRLGVEIAGRYVGLVAGLLAAISPFYVLYSQEARMYILAALMTGLSFLFLLRLLETRSRRNAVLYVLATSLLLYTHVYGLFVLLAQAIIVLHRVHSAAPSARRGELRRWAGILGAVIALYLPWLAVIAKQTGDEFRGTVNTNISWIETPSPGDILDTLIAYAGSGLALAVIALVAAGAILVGIRGIRSGQRLTPPVEAAFGGKHAPVLALWFVTPIVVPFLISIVILPIYVTKYTIPASVAFYLLVSTSIGRFGRGLIGVILLGAVVALMIEGTVSYHRSYTTAPWREATAFLDEQARSGDVILFDKDFSRTNSFAYYWHRDDVFPQDHEDELPPAADRVWVVISLVPEDPGAVPAMLESAGYAQELDRFWEGTPGGIELLLFERPT